MITDTTIITANDVHLAGHCITPGLRDWCAVNKLDFRKFIREGYTVAEFLASGCELAARVVRLKGERDGR